LVTLKIHHKTIYRYNRPVGFGPHRLMLRPRETRDLQLISIDVTATPDATVTWTQDVFGNAVAIANFDSVAERLCIDSFVEIKLDAAAWPVFEIAATAIFFPFL
jgi:transglutaminase-like putative cysteine protease